MSQFSEDDYIRAKLASDTLWYTRYFYKHRFNRKFIVNWHHERICEALDKVYSGEIKKLAIRIAPRYGKTELAVKSFITKGLAINPASKFIHLSYSADLAHDNSEECRDFIQEDEYKRLYPYVELSNDSKAKHKWYTTEGGGVYATSTGGQITGFGAGEVDLDDEDFPEISERFAGAIVIDDGLKPDDAESDTKRERINQRFETTIRSRTNSRNTPIVVIGQALHERDLIGYLILTEPDEWTVLTIPAISIDVEGNEVALWDFKQTLSELHKIREADKRVFESQYQQNPSSDHGKLIPFSSCRFVPPMKEPIAKIAFADPADAGGDNLAVIFLGVYVVDEYLMFRLNDVIYTTDGVESTNERLLDKLRENNTEQIFIEGNGVGKAFIIHLKLSNETECELKPYSQKMNKEAKIASYYEFVRDRFYYAEDYENNKDYVRYISHLTKYDVDGTNTHSKDAMDVSCSAAQILKAKYKELIYK